MWHRRLAGAPVALIGVAHLLPLPGAPRAGPPLREVIARAVADARTLESGGANAIIVENLGDAPFAGDRVPAATVAALARVVLAVREAAPRLALGVNVLRNDASAALGIAAACEADFIRVNVHTGVMATDQGLLTGRARETLLERRLLGSSTRIAADVLVKHAEPIGAPDIGDLAHDTVHRGGAEAVIVSGTGTGRPLALGDLLRARAAVPEAGLWAGSGVRPETLSTALLDALDAAVVGTWLHEDEDLRRPLCPTRVERLRALLQAA